MTLSLKIKTPKATQLLSHRQHAEPRKHWVREARDDMLHIRLFLSGVPDRTTGTEQSLEKAPRWSASHRKTVCLHSPSWLLKTSHPTLLNHMGICLGRALIEPWLKCLISCSFTFQGDFTSVDILSPLMSDDYWTMLSGAFPALLSTHTQTFSGPYASLYWFEFLFGVTQAVLRTNSWLCTWGSSLLVLFLKSYVIPKTTKCKVRALLAVLSL